MARKAAGPAGEAVSDEIRLDLRMGQFFRAYDRARAALEAEGDTPTLRLLAATALLRTGAVAEARETVAAFDRPLDALDPERPAGEAANLLDDLESVALLGRIYRASWRELGASEDLRRARDLELARFHRHGGLVEGATAAVLSRFLDEPLRARDLALLCLSARGRRKAKAAARFGQALATAEALLLLDRTEEADAQLAQAGRLAAGEPTRGVEARQHLRDLAGLGVIVPEALWAHFKPPVVVIFAGAAADLPGQAEPVLPPQAEAPLATALEDLLEELGASIGYCSLAAGSDLIFAEAMIRRGAEVNAVLPFEEADFIAQRVRSCGTRWVERYQAVRGAVADVTPVCQDLYLGNPVLLRFANQVIDGRARLRAAALDTTPTLVAAWDYLAEPLPGSASDFIDHWGDPARLRIVDLADLRDSLPPDAPLPAGTTDGAPREEPAAARAPGGPTQAVRAMLFADVVGYSTIQDHHLPAFWAFLQAVRDRLGARLDPAVHIGSWGDALFIVTRYAVELADIAVGLTEAFESLDARALGLPVRLRLRIGLHAGPVFTGSHPLSGEQVLYGGNVNRAARIEPITVPGRIYASEQFVALLTSEHSAAVVEARMTGEAPPAAWACRYRGELSLAKNYGRQVVYEIAPPDAPAPSHGTGGGTGAAATPAEASR
ncbi:Adenylate and Guanylate cyclase catalytic domain-containing protein [Tistlia consotensis]|uniref:Adenylate and Guanylate cyclase catalytic domain-containing protein n=1 Tax=Tistlia consotensis USBA 355 TaxID=560819 RepID=A0A1Y6CQ82_9PROT|nr:adenylate/guanylate cyclase domain-containing protein [Tistlia consotensis]SMF81233.1 Adenylate and Guanylate cyclase catalytic domain-containing protein [Tistlia consotensis USBA 355]SNS23263.1 Adenylate and Guanylate cyclase catalytic domain-containing protein [Tistlia consotensis]